MKTNEINVLAKDKTQVPKTEVLCLAEGNEIILVTNKALHNLLLEDEGGPKLQDIKTC